MFEIDSTTSWSRYRAALNAAQSKLVLTQDREDVSVRVRPARENVDGQNTVVTVFEAADVDCAISIDFLDTVADCALTIGLTEKTAHELGEKLVNYMHDKYISVGNDNHYVAVDE
jgi:hypothetical protein